MYTHELKEYIEEQKRIALATGVQDPSV